MILSEKTPEGDLMQEYYDWRVRRGFEPTIEQCKMFCRWNRMIENNLQIGEMIMHFANNDRLESTLI